MSNDEMKQQMEGAQFAAKQHLATVEQQAKCIAGLQASVCRLHAALAAVPAMPAQVQQPSDATRLVCLEAAQKLRTYVGIYTGDKQARRLVDELSNIAAALATPSPEAAQVQAADSAVAEKAGGLCAHPFRTGSAIETARGGGKCAICGDSPTAADNDKTGGQAQRGEFEAWMKANASRTNINRLPSGHYEAPRVEELWQDYLRRTAADAGGLSLPHGCFGVSCDTQHKTVTLRFDTWQQALEFYRVTGPAPTTGRPAMGAGSLPPAPPVRELTDADIERLCSDIYPQDHGGTRGHSYDRAIARAIERHITGQAEKAEGASDA